MAGVELDCCSAVKPIPAGLGRGRQWPGIRSMAVEEYRFGQDFVGRID
jgi:hypothetical protein